jgi:hypothetical protein
VVSQHPGFREGWLLRQLNGSADVFVSLWDTRADAELAPERTAARRGPRPFELAHDEVYEVRQADDGAGGDRTPGVAQVIWFDGPRAADDRAGRERAWPATRDLPGLVRAIALSGPGNALVVIVLTVDAETIDAAQQAIMSTALLPGEHAALLGGRDRVDICAVAAGTRTPSRRADGPAAQSLPSCHPER